MTLSYYDPIKDEIVGCKEDSYSYYHERRHQWQYKKGIADKIDIMHIYLYYLAIFSILPSLFFGGLFLMVVIIGILMTPYIIALLLLELDAYIIGYIDYRKVK